VISCSLPRLSSLCQQQVCSESTTGPANARDGRGRESGEATVGVAVGLGGRTSGAGIFELLEEPDTLEVHPRPGQAPRRWKQRPWHDAPSAGAQATLWGGSS